MYLLLLVVAPIVHGTLYPWHFDLSRGLENPLLVVPHGWPDRCETMVESIFSRRWHQPECEMSDQELGKRPCGWTAQTGLPAPVKALKVVTRRLGQSYPVYRKVED